MVDLYPQEITRVFLNLIFDGFYAATSARDSGEGFEPELTAPRKPTETKWKSGIADNGTVSPGSEGRKCSSLLHDEARGEGTGRDCP